MKGGYLILGLAFCLATGPAVAQSAYTPEQLAAAFAKGWRPLQPPSEFAGPYEGKLTVKRVPVAEIPEHCPNIPRILGCAYWDKFSLSYCTVYIPSDVPTELEAAILSHELGHCHGWKHPQPEVAKSVDWREMAIKKAKESPLCQTTPKPEQCP